MIAKETQYVFEYIFRIVNHLDKKPEQLINLVMGRNLNN